MQITGEIIREGGQWKIKLFVEHWVLEDIKLENEKPQSTVIVIHNSLSPSTMYKTHDWYGALLGAILFEEVMDKK